MISFIIITDNKEPEKLKQLVASINKVKGKKDEIIISEDKEGTGLLGKLRNDGAKQAKGDILVFLDDDMLLYKDFVKGVTECSNWMPNWTVLTCRVLNPDGSRHWDWKEHNSGDRLLHYCHKSDDIVLTGGISIIRKKVWDVVKWSNTLGFYEKEDVDYSVRLREKGFRIQMNPYSTVEHQDDRYYRSIGIGVDRDWETSSFS